MSRSAIQGVLWHCRVKATAEDGFDGPAQTCGNILGKTTNRTCALGSLRPNSISRVRRRKWRPSRRPTITRKTWDSSRLLGQPGAGQLGVAGYHEGGHSGSQERSGRNHLMSPSRSLQLGGDPAHFRRGRCGGGSERRRRQPEGCNGHAELITCVDSFMTGSRTRRLTGPRQDVYGCTGRRLGVNIHWY